MVFVLFVAGFSYIGTACAYQSDYPQYQVSISESRGDWVDLSIAHEIGHA